MHAHDLNIVHIFISVGSAKSASGKMVAGSVRAQLARMFPGKSVPENEENVFPVRPVVDEFPSGPIVDPVPPSYMEPNREDFDDYIKEDEAPKVNSEYLEEKGLAENNMQTLNQCLFFNSQVNSESFGFRRN